MRGISSCKNIRQKNESKINELDYQLFPASDVLMDLSTEQQTLVKTTEKCQALCASQ